MNTILLVGINARYTHLNLAIRYLRNYCKQDYYKIELAEYSINEHLRAILENIYTKQPHIIGLSVYIWNTEIIKKLLPDLKKILPNTKIILGGPEVSYNSEYWQKDFPFVDYIVIGAGEAGFKFLVENNFSVAQKIIHINNPSFSTISFPYLDSDFPEIENKYVYYESSRGCQFNCSYCLSSRNDQKFESRDFSDVKNELSVLLEHKPRIIKFVDRTFNSNRHFYREIWKYLLTKNTSTKFHFEIHPNLLTVEDFSILQNCPENLFQFEIGIQSTNEKTLAAVNRPQRWANTKRMIKKLITLKNIHIHLDFIAGLPVEDFTSTKKSINEILSLRPDNFQLGFLKILPGTKISEKQDDFTYSNSAPYEVLKNKWLSFSEIIEIKKVEKVLNIFYNSGKYQMFLENLVKQFSSFFEMFSTIADFRDTHLENNDTKNWKKNAEILVELVQFEFSEKKDFLLDCLRWDWCKIASAHYYPEKLMNHNCSVAKKIGLSKINEIFIMYKIPNIITKSAIFFKPNSTQFQQKYLSDSEIAIFIKVENSKQVYQV